MGDEINANTDADTSGIFRRKRPVPIPIYDDKYLTDRYIERPYLKKHELAKIRDNLDELVEIKADVLNKIEKKQETVPDKVEKIVSNKTSPDKIENLTKSKEPDFFLQPEKNLSEKNPTQITDSNVKSDIKNSDFRNQSINDKKDINPEKDGSKKDELKIGISNLGLEKNDKKDKRDIDIPKKRIIKKKVIKLGDEDAVTYNVSPELRRQMRKAEYKELQDEEKVSEAMKKSVEIAEQNRKELERNRRELEELKDALTLETDKTKDELKKEFGNRFNDINGRFDKVSTKLEETCTGIDCLKKDFANMNKNFEMVECPECNEKIVPLLASFCPGCAAKISGWEDDDGQPVKGWKPNWQK